MDNLTKEQRSLDTKPELKYKAENFNLDYHPEVFGNPDFIDWKNKIVVFIDGCFWHKCPKHFIAPKSNRKYWLPKLEKNVLRDNEINLAYKTSGWKVVRIWEHNLRN